MHKPCIGLLKRHDYYYKPTLNGQNVVRILRVFPSIDRENNYVDLKKCWKWDDTVAAKWQPFYSILRMPFPENNGINKFSYPSFKRARTLKLNTTAIRCVVQCWMTQRVLVEPRRGTLRILQTSVYTLQCCNKSYYRA